MAEVQELMDIPDSEGDYFNIDWNSRVITIPENITCIGVYNDKDTNRIYFRCPVDYGDCKVADFGLHVNYVNIGASGQEYDGDIYFVEDAVVDGGYMTFSWLVGRRAYLEEGNTRFIVCCKIVDSDNNVVNELNTTVSTLPVLEGLEVDAQPEVDYPDYLEELLKKVDTAVQHVEVNGVEQPKVDGTVDLDIDRASYEEDTEAVVLSDMVSEVAIECIKVNGEAQAVDNATVEIDVPTKVSELENDSEYATKDETIAGINVNGVDAPITDRIAEVSVHGFNGIAFAGCQDGPEEEIKVVTCEEITDLYDGLAIYVFFTNASTVSNPKLQINSLEADSITARTGTSGSMATYWTAETFILLIYGAYGFRPASANICTYVSCSTAAATETKSLTIGNLVIVDGTRVTVLFKEGNTATNPKLRFSNMATLEFDVIGNTNWSAGEYVDFVFNGTEWVAL